MGHNRGGDDAKLKKKRRLRQAEREAAKAAAAPSEAKGVVATVTEKVKSAAQAVGDAVKAGVETLTGGKEG
jgi:hypothetical protein